MRGARGWILLSVLALGCGKAAGTDGPDADTDTQVDGTEDALVGILVTPSEVKLPVGESMKLKAVGLEADRGTINLTNTVEWRSRDLAVATVSGGLDREGRVQAVAVGRTTVRAIMGDLESQEVSVEITDAQVAGLEVNPDQVTLVTGQVVSLTATAAYTDGTRSEATTAVRWIIEDPDVATVQGGRVTAVGRGTTRVTARWDEVTAQPVQVQVVPAAEPDLRIRGLAAQVDGTEATVTVTVENLGNVGAGDFYVDVFVAPASAPSPGDFGDAYGYIDWVEEDGGTTSITFEVDVPAGTTTFAAIADTVNAVIESDETNNVSSIITAGGGGGGGPTANPELLVLDLDHIADETDVYFEAEIANFSDTMAGAFDVAFFLDQAFAPTSGDTPDAIERVGTLSGWDSVFVDTVIPTTCADCTSWVVVDWNGAVSEGDETDNVEGPYTFSVTSFGGGDTADSGGWDSASW